MKKKLSITFWIILLSISVQAQFNINSSMFIAPVHEPCIGKIVSYEDPTLATDFQIEAQCYFLDTANIDGLIWQLPEGWSIANLNAMPLAGVAGDSLLLSFILSISDTTHLPFYPQDIKLEMQINRQGSQYQSIMLAGKVYFTPYNSIEIWNLEDFYDLKRKWLHEETIAPPRIYIHRDSIPQSNLGDDRALYERDSATWNDWWIDNFREITVVGLAYNILMKPVSYDSLAYYESLCEDTISATRKTFTGTMSGWILSPIENDLGSDGIQEIGLAGLRVRLMRKYGGVYYNWGEAYTNEEGYFSISYSKNISSNKVELYLRVFSETDNSYTIRSSNAGSVYCDDGYLGSYEQNAGNNIFIISINSSHADAFRSVHWARKGMKYFRDQLGAGNMPGGLIIKINGAGSWTNNYTYVNNPVIHLQTDHGKNESTTYHEFGHYTMYRLQHNNIHIPYGVKGVANHSWGKENTGLLAWIEGWADAVEMILDAAHWREDNEYGQRPGHTYESLEDHNYHINNGFRSEYYIANAIYDLWDGPTKGLPALIPGWDDIHGWDDSKRYNEYTFLKWKSIDDVELTLAQICAPLQTITDSINKNNLRNVGHYYDKLLSLFSNCKDKADISRVFRENRVLWNIKDYEDGFYVGNLSSDSFFTTKNRNELGYLRPEFFILLPLGILTLSMWTDHYNVNIPIRDGTNNPNLYAMPNTSLALTDDYWIGIDTGSMNIPVYMHLNPYANGNNYTHGNFYTCGGNEILVRNGWLELGMPGTGYTADLTINDKSLLRVDAKGKLIVNNNCTLRIAAGGTLYVKNLSSVILRGNANIIVEEGGYICVENGAVVNLQDASSKIIIMSGARHGTNPLLNISGSQCTSICNYNTLGFGKIQCTCSPYTHETLTFTNNQSFSNVNYIIKNAITIKSNATVTFTNSTLRFYENAQVIIEPGGKLIIDGGTFTNACENQMWQGITVMGSTNQQSKGTVTLSNNAKIKNAINGITVIGDATVTATNAQFINNKAGVLFYGQTAGQSGTSGTFTKTSFSLNNDYIGNITQFQTHIHMENSGAVTVKGCEFSSIAPQGNQNGRNNGIVVINSPLTVTEYCSKLSGIPIGGGKCSLGEPSVFTGFRYGISAYNTGVSPTFDVRFSEFKDNFYGIKIEGINYHKVIGNHFIFENNSYSYGLYVLNSTGYKIEENNFKNLYPAIENTGLTIKSSGSAENEVYKNIFDGLYIGQNFLRRNSAQKEMARDGGIPISLNAGLQTLCNTFEKTYSLSAIPHVHILIGTLSLNLDNDHIRKSQGGSTMATGNKFMVTPTYLKIKNNKHAIDYYYNISNNNETPTPCSSNVNPINTAPDNNCPSKIGSIIIITPQNKGGMGDLEKYLTQYDEWNAEYKYWLARWYEVCGEEAEDRKQKAESDENLTLLRSYDFPVSEECEYILQMVSYYSALKDNYFNGIIVAAMSEEGEKENGEKEKGNFYEKLRFLFNYRNNYTDNLCITESYMAENQFGEALASLNQIYEQFELTEEQNAELKGLKTYIHWLQQLEEKGKTIYALSEDEVMYLVNYVETNTGRGRVFANNILCGLYDICIEEESGEEGESRKQKAESDQENLTLLRSYALTVSNNALENIKLVPNPTTGELQITNYELQITNIEVFDIYGRKLSSNHLITTSSHHLINISHLQAGIYFVKITTEIGEVIKKVVKQ
jgi:hypothetical protein